MHSMTKQQNHQVFPIVDYEKEVSQRPVDAALENDYELACLCLNDPFVEVNFIGSVNLRSKMSEVILHDESAHEVRFEYEEIRTEATALFIAAQSGNSTLVRTLLSAGACVNQKLFRGFATTAAVREGNLDILQMLIEAGAYQPACEEAVMEASYFGNAKAAKILMGLDMIRPCVAVHALVTACCRGFVDVVATLFECGVDANANDRVLLQSSKPCLFANVDCNALVAAVVSRQTSVVQFLLKVGVGTDFKVRLGAWSWDITTGEEFRVGVGLADPYDITWSAVEYFEASGTILRMLLAPKPIKHTFHNGLTLIHHAIICGNMNALDVLLSSNHNVELPVNTMPETGLQPIHLASRLGLSNAVRRLISAGCNLNSRTSTGDTALMICVRHKRDECLTLLASTGADFGLTNLSNLSARSLAVSTRWNMNFRRIILDTIRAGKSIFSSDYVVFAPLVFVTKTGDVEALKRLIKISDTDLNQQDEFGFSAAMVAAMDGQEAALKLLVFAGANLRLTNKEGQTAMSLSKLHHNGDMFDKIVKEYKQETQNKRSGLNVTHPLHHAALSGDIDMVRLLITSGYDVNVVDSKGNTPLMLAAKLGHGMICKILISLGAKCETKNKKGETALSLSKTTSVMGNEATKVIMDEMGRKRVLIETQMKKHVKGGKGSPHKTVLKMVEESGMLSWGKNSGFFSWGKNKKRNVVCSDVQIGACDSFRWNRRKKFDTDESGIFHVVTTKNKSVHFVCEGGNEEAELWVRGIRIVTSEAGLFRMNK